MKEVENVKNIRSSFLRDGYASAEEFGQNGFSHWSLDKAIGKLIELGCDEPSIDPHNYLDIPSNSDLLKQCGPRGQRKVLNQN